MNAVNVRLYLQRIVVPEGLPEDVTRYSESNFYGKWLAIRSVAFTDSVWTI